MWSFKGIPFEARPVDGGYEFSMRFASHDPRLACAMNEPLSHILTKELLLFCSAPVQSQRFPKFNWACPNLEAHFHCTFVCSLCPSLPEEVHQFLQTFFIITSCSGCFLVNCSLRENLSNSYQQWGMVRIRAKNGTWQT